MPMISDEDQNIAIRFNGYAQKYVVCPSGRQYVFMPNHNISIAFVNPDDVQYVINKKVGCCGNQKYSFHVATPEEYNTWIS